MLPPNLTRHYWEARRAFLQSAGREVEPWFQLTPASRAVAESEVELFRQAIRAAEEEQDLLAALDAPAQAAEEPAAATDDTPEDCPCPGCSAVAVLLELVGSGAGRLEDSSRWDMLRGSQAPGAAAFRVVPLGDVALTSENKARIQEAARKAVDMWVAAGKPLNLKTDLTSFTGIRVSEPLAYSFADLRRDMAIVQSFTGIGRA
ncbi:hypothetical protein ABZV52_29955 [Streptomyces sp. NPDC004735]|uniref:hypothetical protein n=1 Tax=Streptomyces sp. NPDC004735 TaxID=3156654 RepID=UPI0033A98F17